MNEIFVRGGVYLANLNPSRGSEVGKIRPILVIQSNAINQVNKTVVMLPLSTKLVDNSTLHFRINKRDKLFNNSDVLCTQFRALDVDKFTSTMLTKLSRGEMQQIEEKLGWILGFND